MLLIGLGWGDRADVDVGEVADVAVGGVSGTLFNVEVKGGSCVDGMSVEAEDDGRV